MNLPSQLLSNFKLFSQNKETTSSIKEDITKSNYPIIFGVVILSICVFVYFRKEELKMIFSGISQNTSEFIGKLWLDTHLTSNGELASTYVPANFSMLSSNVDN